jgi:hypothetical protein
MLYNKSIYSNNIKINNVSDKYKTSNNSIYDIVINKDNKNIKYINKYNCIFLHGAGENPIKTYTTNNTIVNYWGNNIKKFTPHCKKYTFIHTNTKNYTWYNEELVKLYCDVAICGNNYKNCNNKYIKNSIVYTHSMGNLILAYGIYKNFCKFDYLSQSQWISIQPPFYGSKISDFLYNICKYKNKYKIYNYIANKYNYCDNSLPYKTYISLMTNNTSLFHSISHIIYNNINSTLCGTSYIGYYSSYSLDFTLLNYISGIDIINDGMVDYLSCSKFNNDKINYYDINHADGTCITYSKYYDLHYGCKFYDIFNLTSSIKIN